MGTKGAASPHESYGLIHTNVQAYLARHPEASFDEIELKCFKGKDMKHEFTAISPVNKPITFCLTSMDMV